MVLLAGSSIAAVAALLIAHGRPVNSLDFEASCIDFAGTLDIDNATVISSEVVSAGTNFTLPTPAEGCSPGFQVVSVDICRVVLTVATSSRSSTRIEAWLPQAAKWTGRILSTGGGGIGGCISYPDMAYGASLGFAALGSNGGHDGQTGVPFLNNEDVIADYAWRSLHTTANVAKAIAPQFYQSNYTKAYYLGCSTGGRQGWKSAQSYPGDFDGIVAGAPAFSFSNLTSWSGTFYQILQAAGPTGFPNQTAWPAIDASILSQCDALDGSTDGIVETASLCNAIYRPESLICDATTTNTSTCITALQASTLRALFSPLYGQDGAQVYPALPAAPLIASFVYNFFSPQPFLYTRDWYRYAVYNDPSYDVARLTPADWAYAWHLDPATVNTWSGDLSAFRDRGGKVLTYHGQNDPIITPLNSERYYNHVARTMGAAAADLDEFYRFFRVSGMAHCRGGPGASNIGASESTAGVGTGPEDSVLMAVVRWVEDGVPPETVKGVKFAGDGAQKQVDYTREHCRYPLRNVFTDGAWTCV